MRIRLVDICHGRSGDKGDTANIGLVARRPEYFPIMQKYVTAEAVRRHFEGICLGEVRRYELPNLCALNFLLEHALGGGGTVSLKNDAQGKTLSTALLRMEVDITEHITIDRQHV